MIMCLLDNLADSADCGGLLLPPFFITAPLVKRGSDQHMAILLLLLLLDQSEQSRILKAPL